MKILGTILIVLAVLYLVSWCCHGFALAIGGMASSPPNGLLELLWFTFWGIVGMLVSGILAIPYVLLHSASIWADILVITGVMGVGFLMRWLGDRSNSPRSAH